MENHDSRWVDERMASLDPVHLNPDVDRGLARLREPRRGGFAFGKWAVPVAVASAAAVLAFPAPRAVAQRCVDACAGLFVTAPKPVAVVRGPGVPIPDLLLTDSAGARFRLSDYRGKVVLLNFWATWCPPCVKEMPVFTALESKYSGRGFAAVGVALDEKGWETVRPFLDKHRPGYRIALGGDEATNAYGVEKLPETFLLGRGGEILSRWAGAVTGEEAEREIARAIE